MKTQKLVMVPLVLAALLIALGLRPSSAQEIWLSPTRERTEQYLASVAFTMLVLAPNEDDEDGVDPVTRARYLAQVLRKIPRQGVDRQAVVLTWKTAELFDKVANLEIRARENLRRCFVGGALSGAMMASNDPDAATAGGVLFFLNLLVSGAQGVQLDNEAKQLMAEAEQLGKAWEAYLQQFVPASSRSPVHPARNW